MSDPPAESRDRRARRKDPPIGTTGPIRIDRCGDRARRVRDGEMSGPSATAHKRLLWRCCTAAKCALTLSREASLPAQDVRCRPTHPARQTRRGYRGDPARARGRRPACRRHGRPCAHRRVVRRRRHRCARRPRREVPAPAATEAPRAKAAPPVPSADAEPLPTRRPGPRPAASSRAASPARPARAPSRSSLRPASRAGCCRWW